MTSSIALFQNTTSAAPFSRGLFHFPLAACFASETRSVVCCNLILALIFAIPYSPASISGAPCLIHNTDNKCGGTGHGRDHNRRKVTRGDAELSFQLKANISTACQRQHQHHPKQHYHRWLGSLSLEPYHHCSQNPSYATGQRFDHRQPSLKERRVLPFFAPERHGRTHGVDSYPAPI